MNSLMDKFEEFLLQADKWDIAVVMLLMVLIAVGIGGLISYVVVNSYSRQDGIFPISEGDSVLRDPTLEIYDEEVDLTPSWKGWTIFTLACLLVLYIYAGI